VYILSAKVYIKATIACVPTLVIQSFMNRLVYTTVRKFVTFVFKIPKNSFAYFGAIGPY